MINSWFITEKYYQLILIIIYSIIQDFQLFWNWIEKVLKEFHSKIIINLLLNISLKYKIRLLFLFIYQKLRKYNNKFIYIFMKLIRKNNYK